MPRSSPADVRHRPVGVPLGLLDPVVPGDLEAVPRVADGVDLHVEVPGPRHEVVQLRGGGHVGVDRVDVVARVAADRPGEAAPHGKRLVCRVEEPGEEEVVAAERVHGPEKVGPILRREVEERGEERVREGGQDGLAVLARRRLHPGELQDLERGLAGRDRGVVLRNGDRPGHLQELVDRVGRDRDDPVEPRSRRSGSCTGGGRRSRSSGSRATSWRRRTARAAPVRGGSPRARAAARCAGSPTGSRAGRRPGSSAP